MTWFLAGECFSALSRIVGGQGLLEGVFLMLVGLPSRYRGYGFLQIPDSGASQDMEPESALGLSEPRLPSVSLGL